MKRLHFAIHLECYKSLPTRERGLKLPDCEGLLLTLQSLPTRERGLKLNKLGKDNAFKGVAPYAGAWIETIMQRAKALALQSLPTRERGLKLLVLCVTCSLLLSLPTRERGLKLFLLYYYKNCTLSLPTRERGLKQGLSHVF